MTRLLVATASATTRSWFTAFPATPRLSIVGITEPAALGVRVHELDPDIVLIDITSSELDDVGSSLETLGDAGVNVILLADREHVPVPLANLVRMGVRGVLSRQPTLEELESALRAVDDGLVVMDPDVIEGRPHRAGAARVTGPLGLPVQPLTPREVDVLNALAEGLGNKQIAARLEISEHTVKTHLAAIFEKLETSNRTEAVMAGARLGLVLL